MNTIGMPEMIVIALILALLVIPAGLVVGLVIYLVKRSRKAVSPPVPANPVPSNRIKSPPPSKRRAITLFAHLGSFPSK